MERTSRTMTREIGLAALLFPILLLLSQRAAFAQADMTLSMTHSPDPVTLGTGQNISYSIVVRNAGPGGATGVTLTDTLDPSLTFVSATPPCTQASGTVTCDLGSVAAFASQVVTIVVTPTAATTTPLSNTASVTATEPDPNPANNSATNYIAVLAANADLQVSMSHSPDPVTLGTAQNVSFSITVSNRGPSGATNVTLTDTLDPSLTFVSATAPCTQASGTVTCNFGSMAVSASRSVAIIVTPTTATSTTPLSNIASATATEPDPNPGNNSATNYVAVLPATANLQVRMSHSPDPVTLGTTGQNLSFSISVSNRGPSGATGVTLTDTLDPSLTFVSATAPCTQASGTVTCSFGSMAVSASRSVTIIVTPTAAATITNIASVTATEPDTNPADNSWTNTVAINPAAADVRVTMSHLPEPARVGSNLTYSASVFNAGPSAASNVTLTDALPASVSFVSATSSQGSCSQLSGTVTCAIGSMVSGAGVGVTIVVNPPAAATFSNTASVTATEPDPNPANNSATNAVTAVTGPPNPTDADLQVTMSHSPEPFTLGSGQFLQYNIVVRNNGPAAATGVTLSDTLPAGVNFNAATVSPPTQGSCSLSAGTVTCTLGNLNVSSSVTVTLYVTPTVVGTLSNTANGSATQTDPNPANNSATDAVSINDLSADLFISGMSHSPVRPNVTDQFFSYSIGVSNRGPSPATGATLSDVLPASLTFSAATVSPPTMGSCSNDPTTSTVTCSFGNLNPSAGVTVTIFVSANAAGTVSNTASVSSSVSDPNLGNNSATDNVTVNGATADLRLSMSHSPDPITIGDGQFLQFLISLFNAGPSPASNVSLTDTLPPGLTFAATSVAPPTQGTCAADPATGTVTCTLGTLASGGSVSVTVYTSPAAAGTISNTATVTATESDPNPGNNLATNGVALKAASADLSLTLSHSPDPVRVGQSLQYFIALSNRGPSTATGVTVTDTLPASMTFAASSVSPPTQGTCTQASGTVTCNLNTMGAGASASVTIFVTPTATSPAITNTASVSGNENDPNPGNNLGTNYVTVNAAATPGMPAPTLSLAPQTTAARTVAYAVNDLGPLPGGAPGAGTPGGPSVGFAVADNGEMHAVIYDTSGLTRDLGTLGGGQSFAFGINTLGQVVGQSEIATGETHAFLYDREVMRDLGTLGGDFSAALGVNDSGEVVGSSVVEGGHNHAFLYRGSTMIDLNDLIAGDSGWILELAFGFDSVGQIVGYGNFRGEEHVFMLVPR